MTRINSAIDVKCLTDEHLLAEHREIKRLPSYFHKFMGSKLSSYTNVSRIPKEFTLGKGHVLFFMDKHLFTLHRYFKIYNECKQRNFVVMDYSEDWLSLTGQVFNDYTPTLLERRLLEKRISTRILESKKKFFHYYGEAITKQEAIKILKKSWK